MGPLDELRLMPITHLPVVAVAEQFLALVHSSPQVVVQAAPGTGKSTVLPLLLLADAAFGGRRILLLQPRRLAAYAVAERIAELRRESIGKVVGLRMRDLTLVSPETRLEVVTEGVLSRLLNDDPLLEDTSAVIFDEVHERSLQTELALGLCAELQRDVRPDLRIIAMSATANVPELKRVLPAALDLALDTSLFPVTHHYLDKRPPLSQIPQRVARTIVEAIRTTKGDLLVFLPGRREIRAVERLLHALVPRDLQILTLYGELSTEEQRAVLRPRETELPRVILATSIAETSLTVPGIRTVIDSGLTRTSYFNPSTGLAELRTEPSSKDAADQRAGRAGRLGAGECFRMWGPEDQRTLRPSRMPEVTRQELTGALLELYAWGIRDPFAFPWMTVPSSEQIRRADQTLVGLGAITENRILTPFGRALAPLPAPPRLGAMVLRAAMSGFGDTGAALAALLETEAGRSGKHPVDIAQEVRLLRGALRGHAAARPQYRSAIRRWRQISKALPRSIPGADFSPVSESLGLLIATAFPELIARRIQEPELGRPTRYLLSTGTTAEVRPELDLHRHELLAVADAALVSGAAPQITLAAALPMEIFVAAFKERFSVETRTGWDGQDGLLSAQTSRRYGAIVVDVQPEKELAVETKVAALLDALAAGDGVTLLSEVEELRVLQARAAFAAQSPGGSTLPDISDATLLSRAGEWLPTYAAGVRRLSDLRSISALAVARSLLSYNDQRTLDIEAPLEIALPHTERRFRLHYGSGEGPELRATVQELLGCSDTPTVGTPRSAVTVVLLSPARRPIQTTRDLRGFWSGSYQLVRKELRGRYPKHRWPEKPLEE